MVRTKAFAIGFVFAFMLISCAGFGYKYYKVDLEQGMLIGNKPNNDRSLNICKRVNDEYQCIAMTIDEFFVLKEDFERLRDDLDDCQRWGPSS